MAVLAHPVPVLRQVQCKCWCSYSRAISHRDGPGWSGCCFAVWFKCVLAATMTGVQRFRSNQRFRLKGLPIYPYPISALSGVHEAEALHEYG